MFGRRCCCASSSSTIIITERGRAGGGRARCVCRSAHDGVATRERGPARLVRNTCSSPPPPHAQIEQSRRLHMRLPRLLHPPFLFAIPRTPRIHHEWDEYRDAVYGRTMTPRATGPSRVLCVVLSLRLPSDRPSLQSYHNTSVLHRADSWRHNCASASARLPLAPKVWMADADSPSCQAPFREAFVGVRLAAHVRKNPSWRGWPNPEHKLAPYGLWLYPRPLPSCLPNNTWVEVVRIREAYESKRTSTWYYHAPGSGVWLNTGRSACVANVQRDAHQFTDPAHVATPAALARTASRSGRAWTRSSSGRGRALRSTRCSATGRLATCLRLPTCAPRPRRMQVAAARRAARAPARCAPGGMRAGRAGVTRRARW